MSELNLKVQFKAFDKMSQQFENIRKNAGRLGRAFDDNIKTLKKLDDQMHLVNSFKKRERELSTLANDIEKTKNKSREFQYQLALAQKNNATAKQIQSLTDKYQKNQQKTNDLIKQHQQLKTKLGEAGSKLKAAGIGTKNLTAKQKSLNSAAEKVNHTLNNQSQKLEKLADRQKKIAAAKETFGNGMRTAQNMSVAGYASMAVGRKIIDSGFGSAFQEAAEIEQAFAGVSKFAPEFEGNTQKQIAFMQKLKEQAAELSMQTGKTQTNIAEMYEEMGAAGLVADKWGSYANKFIKGAVALDMDVGQLSQTALGIAAATGHKNDDVWLQAILEKANIASDTGSMKAYNVLEVANRGMGVAKAAGIDENAFIALSGAALDAKAQDEVVGRAWKTIATRLTTTVKLTKAQAVAWDNLNIDPETFTKAFKKDPIGMLKKLTDAAEKSGDKMGNLGLIVGMDFADTVLKMGDNIKTAKAIYKNITDEQQRAKKFQDEYNRMAQPMIKGFSDWAKENKELVRWGVKLALIIGGAAFALGGLGIVMSGLLVPFSMAKHVITLFSIALANPVILAFTATIGVIAGLAYLIYKNWDWLKAKWAGIWQSMTGWASDTWNLLKTDTLAGLAKIGGTILNWSPLGLFYKAFAGVMSYFGVEMPNTFTGFMSSIGNSILETVANWDVLGVFKKVFDIAVKWVTDKINGILDTFKNLKKSVGEFFGTKLSPTQNELLKHTKGKQQAPVQSAKSEEAKIRQRLAQKKITKQGNKQVSTTINNHITVSGGGDARQVAARVKQAISDATIYDGAMA